MSKEKPVFTMPYAAVVQLKCDDALIAMAMFEPVLVLKPRELIEEWHLQDELDRNVKWSIGDVVISHTAKPWQHYIAEDTFRNIGGSSADWLENVLICRLESAHEKALKAYAEDLSPRERNWSWKLVKLEYLPHEMLGDGRLGEVRGEAAQKAWEQHRAQNPQEDDGD